MYPRDHPSSAAVAIAVRAYDAGGTSCGRCAAACLPDIADPVAVYNALKERKEDDSTQRSQPSRTIHP